MRPIVLCSVTFVTCTELTIAPNFKFTSFAFDASGALSPANSCRAER